MASIEVNIEPLQELSEQNIELLQELSEQNIELLQELREQNIELLQELSEQNIELLEKNCLLSTKIDRLLLRVQINQRGLSTISQQLKKKSANKNQQHRPPQDT